MAIRRKLLLAFAIALSLQLVQNVTVGVFVRRMQSEVEDVTRLVAARQNHFFAADIVKEIRRQIQFIVESPTSTESVAELDAYWDQLIPMVRGLVEFKRHKVVDPTVLEKISSDLRKATVEHERLFAAGPDKIIELSSETDVTSATKENLFFFEKSLATLAKTLRLSAVEFDQKLQTALQRERRIHQLPNRAGLMVTGATAILLAAFAWIFSSWFVKPLQTLSSVLTRVGTHEDLSQRVSITSSDEIGTLGKAYNGMADRIEREFAERKKAEEELAIMHKKLVDTARRVGMADIATSVLHNVGNVLNSVNVSTSTISEQIRTLGIGDFSKAVELIQNNREELGTFITTDERGKHLPDFLIKLGGHLTTQEASILVEVDSLCKSVDHIKSIVSMQQSHAGPSGIIENASLAEIVEDAIRINIASIERHGITISHEIEEIPSCRIDKHKVLQILVNLISNAKYAVLGHGESDPRIIVCTSQVDDHVRIEVVDNGVGIPPENITRVFAHGFTTRQEGHGFGLHSAALVAKELGGILTAQSDGPGAGASFTLEIPFQSQSEKLCASKTV